MRRHAPVPAAGLLLALAAVLSTAVLSTTVFSAAVFAQTEPAPAAAERPRVPESEVGVNALVVVGQPAGPPRSGAELDEVVEEVAGVMRCPVCQGLSVADSPSKTAVAMKSEVRDLLAEGYSPVQVLQYFEKSYGEFVLLEPKAKGFNLFVWVAPIAALFLGLVLVSLRLRSGAATAKAAAPAAAEDPELAAYREQVRREVGA